MHVFDEVTEQLQILEQMVKESSEFSNIHKYNLTQMFEEIENYISDIVDED